MSGTHNSTSNDTSKQEPITNLVLQLEDTPSIIPDRVTASYMNSAGFEDKDPRVTRLISLASQKFMSELVTDAMQLYKVKLVSVSRKHLKDKKATLTMEDLDPALNNHNINPTKPPYTLWLTFSIIIIIIFYHHILSSWSSSSSLYTLITNIIYHHFVLVSCHL